MTRKNKLLGAFLGIMLCAGCVGNNADFKAYVLADRLNHDVLSTHYTQYLNADPALDESAKRTFLRRVEAKEEMLTAAEQALGLKPLPVNQ